MLEVKSMRTYQSVKVGSGEYTYLNSDTFKMEFKPEYGCVMINGEVLVPTNNIPWLVFKEKISKPRGKSFNKQQVLEFE